LKRPDLGRTYHRRRAPFPGDLSRAPLKRDARVHVRGEELHFPGRSIPGPIEASRPPQCPKGRRDAFPGRSIPGPIEAVAGRVEARFQGVHLSREIYPGPH